MTFPADFIFKDYEYLFCEEFDEGHQAFQSWEEFLDLYSKYMHHNTKPLFVYTAFYPDDGPNPELFVDVSQIIIIPWDELENFI